MCKLVKGQYDESVKGRKFVLWYYGKGFHMIQRNLACLPQQVKGKGITHPSNIMSIASILADGLHECLSKAVEDRQVTTSYVVLVTVWLPEGDPCN